MNRDTYYAFYKRINGTVYQKALTLCDKGCVILTAVAYMLLLLYYTLQQDRALWLTVGIPALAFALLSLIRARLNCPRPYETWDIPPLISKATVGKSFPSRHIFSAFLIATVCLRFHPILGIVLYALAAELAVIRVICGVHFTKDVVAGAAAGVAVGLVYLGCLTLC